MISSFTTFFTKKSVPQKTTTPVAPSPTSSGMQRRNNSEKASFSKNFRWRLPAGTEEPRSVQIVGSFNNWQRIEMKRDTVLNGWHATVNQIPGNRTHHYMLLVDGKPTLDGNCDGLAIPQGFSEQEFQLETEKGPRVLMLFSQTK